MEGVGVGVVVVVSLALPGVLAYLNYTCRLPVIEKARDLAV